MIEKDIDLFPGYLLSADSRHPKNVFVCPVCGELTETVDRKKPGQCFHCAFELTADGPAKRSRCRCPECSADNHFPNAELGAPKHRLFAMEYHCPECKLSHKGRFFKKPDDKDIANIKETAQRWSRMRPKYVPEAKIPSGDETNRLHRWGYTHYREMFNDRQLLGLELSARIIADTPNRSSVFTVKTKCSGIPPVSPS